MRLEYRQTPIKLKTAGKEPLKRIPFQESESSQFSQNSQLNKFHEKPVKSNSQNLAFTGFSYSGVSKAVEKYGDDFGSSAQKFFEQAIEKAHSNKSSGLVYDKSKDLITVEQSTFGKRVIDTVSYPFFNMHLDISNGLLELIGKIPFLKKSKAMESIYNLPLLKNRREKLLTDSNVPAIKAYLESMKSGKNVFKAAHSAFNPTIGNYSTIADRTLTRTVTGAVPAFFLANDAYNLSVYMNNNKDVAKHEKKRRFNQELARIGLTAGATFGALSMFPTTSNKSAAATVWIISGVTLLSEIIGRMAVGTPVLPVSAKSAEKYARKQGKITPEIEKALKEKEDAKAKNSDQASLNAFQGKKKEHEKPPEKGSLTLGKVLKVVTMLAVGGFAADKLKNVKAIKEVLESINNKYKALYTKEFTMTRKELDEMVLKLKENGLEPAANKYKEMFKDQKGDVISLGKDKDKVKHSVIHQLLAFPIWYSWSVLMTPYKVVVKPLIKLVTKKADKVEKTAEELAKETAGKAKKDLEKQQKSMRNFVAYFKKNKNKQNLGDKINAKYLASFDEETKSQYSNADLSTHTKNAASAVTSGFLIADNYNMVMVDSSGQDKELAEQKAKERTIQRGIRLLYGALIIKLFNGVFSNVYNGSLLGAQAVNVANTGLIESLERTSVGLPLGESNRKEIERIEKEHLEATGFKGAYFRMMAKLTGKKALSEKAEK